MQILKFAAALLLTLGLVFLLNQHQPFGSPLMSIGPFFSPFTGFWQNAEAVDAPDSKEYDFAALEAPVQVAFDERRVPHIFAANARDAAFVQGYITASDRLWQMDISMRATVGRLSEVAGERALKRDLLQRRKGILWAAENTLKGWSRAPEELALLEAYSEGVNAYVATLSPAEYPLEFKLMGYAPEPWSPLKCAIFFKSMAESLCGRHEDVARANSRAILGEELYQYLFPEMDPEQSPIIPNTVKWDFEPVPLKREKAEPAVMMSGLLPHEPLPQPPRHIGSNNWAVAGSKTASGKPILANDPHLGLSLPSIWYEIQLHTPQFNTYGVSLPGVPGVIIGFNEQVAWGETNVGQDVLDWYTIEWADEEKNTYLYDGQPRAVKPLVEVIHVRGWDEPLLDTVKYTEWGPVVYEDSSSAYADMAMRWIAHDVPEQKPFYEMGAFYRLMSARGYEDYRAALMGYENPAQNFAFASREGDVAITVNGKFPLRPEGQGEFVQDGSEAGNAWYGFIPMDQVPHVRNPERGFVASANQRSTGPDYPYYYHGYFDHYRGRYINRRLEEMENITVEDMMALQLDNYSIVAEEGVPLLLAALDSAGFDFQQYPQVEALNNWDYRFEKEAVAPSVFEGWLRKARRLAFDELTDNIDSVEVELPDTWRFLSLLEQDARHLIFDHQQTEEIETGYDIALRALVEVVAEGPLPVWGKYKDTRINHLSGIPAFSRQGLFLGGYEDAPNAIKEGHGPSWRMIVQLGDEVEAYGIYPGGQSGNPGSPYYQNSVDDWAEGKYNKLFFMNGPDDREQPVLQASRFRPKK